LDKILSAIEIPLQEPISNSIKQVYEDCLDYINRIDKLKIDFDKLVLRSKTVIKNCQNPEEVEKNLSKLENHLMSTKDSFEENISLIKQMTEISENMDLEITRIENWLNDNNSNKLNANQIENERLKTNELIERKNTLIELFSKTKFNCYNQIIDKYNELIDTLQQNLKQKSENNNLKEVEKDISIELENKEVLENGSENSVIETPNEQQIQTEQQCVSFSTPLSSSTPKSTSVSYPSSPISLKETTPTTEMDSPSVLSDASVSDFIARINKRREAVSAVKTQLETFSELNGKDYEEFGKQESALKSVKESLDNVKPKIEQIMSGKENFLNSFDEESQVTRIINKMWDEWSQVKEEFMKLHRRWWKARELLQQFETALRQIKAWLDSTEQILANSRLQSGELNIEIAKKHQELLMNQFQKHVPIYGTVKVLSNKVITNCTSNNGSVLKDQLDSVEKRWKSVVRELSWRRERLQNNGNLDSLSQWNDLRSWLQKCELVLKTTYGDIKDLKTATKTLSQIRVSMISD
jgi:hypothetical protein